MNNLNSVLIEGNIVRDPHYRTTPRGTPICTFSLASNRYYKKDSGYETETSFYEVESWGKQAENVNTHGRKGRGVRVIGRLKQERWENAEGKAMAKVLIISEHVEFRPDFKKDNAAQSEDETAGESVEEENMVPAF